MASPKPSLEIDIGKPKPSDAMGEEPEAEEVEEDDVDTALDDACTAARDGDKGGFREAMRAAMAAYMAPEPEKEG